MILFKKINNPISLNAKFLKLFWLGIVPSINISLISLSLKFWSLTKYERDSLDKLFKRAGYCLAKSSIVIILSLFLAYEIVKIVLLGWAPPVYTLI